MLKVNSFHKALASVRSVKLINILKVVPCFRSRWSDQVFKPPSRSVHPRLQTLIERYKDGAEGEENGKEGEGSKVTPQVRGEGLKVTSGEGSSVTSSKVTPQIRTGGWPYKKLPTQQKASKGSVEKPLQEAGSAKTGNTDVGNRVKNDGDTKSSNGNGVKEDGQKATSLMDSQEQRDISALIQK